MTTNVSVSDSSNNLLSLIIPELPSNNNTIVDSTPIGGMSNLAQVLLEKIPLPVYNLNVEQMTWIQDFIRVSPKSFDAIVADIQTITADGKIDVQDIPTIVKLFANIYHSGAVSSGLVNAQNVIAFIKFTFDVIIDSKFLFIPDMEKKTIEAVVDASLSLLAMNIDTIETVQKKWYNFISDACPSWKR